MVALFLFKHLLWQKVIVYLLILELIIFSAILVLLPQSCMTFYTTILRS